MSEQEIADAIKTKVSELNELIKQGNQIGLLADITFSTDWSVGNNVGLNVEMFKKTIY